MGDKLKEINMALSETTINDKIEVLQLSAGYPIVQVRSATIISRDDVEISRSFHRRVVTPAADLSAEDSEVVRFSPDAFFTGKSASGTATVYITPGQGL